MKTMATYGKKKKRALPSPKNGSLLWTAYQKTVTKHKSILDSSSDEENSPNKPNLKPKNRPKPEKHIIRATHTSSYTKVPVKVKIDDDSPVHDATQNDEETFNELTKKSVAQSKVTQKLSVEVDCRIII